MSLVDSRTGKPTAPESLMQAWQAVSANLPGRTTRREYEQLRDYFISGAAIAYAMMTTPPANSSQLAIKEYLTGARDRVRKQIDLYYSRLHHGLCPIHGEECGKGPRPFTKERMR